MNESGTGAPSFEENPPENWVEPTTGSEDKSGKELAQAERAAAPHYVGENKPRNDGSGNWRREAFTSQQINDRNEADEINTMVDKGLITTEEAAHYDFDTEIVVPKALIKNPPKVSEAIRNNIISKFTTDNFKPESARGLDAHGTTFGSLQPLWHGTSKRKTGTYGVYHNPAMTNSIYRELPNRHDFSGQREGDESTGIFKLVGWTAQVREHGFGADPETGNREITNELPGTIILVMEHLHGGDPKAVILTKWEHQSITDEIARLKVLSSEVEEGKTFNQNRDSYWSVPRHIFSDLARKARDISTHQDLRDKYLNQLLIEENIDSKKKMELEKVAGAVYENERSSDSLTQLIFNQLKEQLTSQETSKYINQHISYLQGLQEKYPNQELYDWMSQDSDSQRIFTLEQMANYAANTMMTGVDKSKMVPIYDWDGNLLWPKESDVIGKGETIPSKDEAEQAIEETPATNPDNTTS